MQPLSLFVFFFALAGEGTFIKMLSIEGRCVIGPENTLFAGASGDFTGWSSEGVNTQIPILSYLWILDAFVLQI